MEFAIKAGKFAASVLGIGAVSIIAIGLAQRGPAFLQSWVDPD